MKIENRGLRMEDRSRGSEENPMDKGRSEGRGNVQGTGFSADPDRSGAGFMRNIEENPVKARFRVDLPSPEACYGAAR
nr:hypothetical protein [Verrucomicrobiae bacterium]